MKRYANLIILIVAVVFLLSVLGSTTLDYRNRRKNPIARYAFTQQSWDTGDGHAAGTDSIAGINMLLERIDVIISSVTANPTVDVTITDENSCTIASLTSLADGTNHVKLSTKATPDFDAIPLYNTLTVSVDPSADPGGVSQSLTVDVILYGP